MTASKFICGLSPEIWDSEAHLILLKYLADAREISMALEHLKWVEQRSPCTLKYIRAGLLASLSSVSCSQSIVQFLQVIPDA